MDWYRIVGAIVIAGSALLILAGALAYIIQAGVRGGTEEFAQDRRDHRAGAGRTGSGQAERAIVSDPDRQFQRRGWLHRASVRRRARTAAGAAHRAERFTLCLSRMRRDHRRRQYERLPDRWAALFVRSVITAKGTRPAI